MSLSNSHNASIKGVLRLKKKQKMKDEPIFSPFPAKEDQISLQFKNANNYFKNLEKIETQGKLIDSMEY